MNKNHKPIEVVLIYPKTSMDFGSAVAPPFSLLTIAAPLYKKGVRIKIIDQRLDRDWMLNLREALRDKPICCGISTMTGRQIHFGIQAAKLIHQESNGKIPIIWGGIHPTLMPEQTLRSQYADIICLGEGEQTFSELVEAIKSKRSLTGVKGVAYLENDKYKFSGDRPILDVNQLLPTPWELIDVEAYINPDLYLKESKRVLDIGQSSRGCPYGCIFCYNAGVHKSKWRAMSVENTLNMIEDNVKKFNLDGIWLRDDEFFLDINRAEKICEGILDRNLKISWYTSGIRITDMLRASDTQLKTMRKSGIYVLRFGAESGSNRMLDFMKKGQTREQVLEVNRRCKEMDFKPIYSFLFGVPTESFAEVNQTIDLFFQLKKENPQASLAPFSQYTAFPGTPLYDIAVKMGLKSPEKFEDWADWLSTEKDTKGRRLPWLRRNQRRWLGNIVYMGNISFAGAELVSTVRERLIDHLLSFLVKPLSLYFIWRLRRKYYRIVPEVQPIIKLAHLYSILLNRRR